MVMKPTSPTPIISADALAAVRLGLRIAFSRASSPVSRAAGAAAQPSSRLSGSATVRPRMTTPKNTEGAEPHDQAPAATGAEQADHQRADPVPSTTPTHGHARV